METPETDIARVKKAVDSLSEHYDSVLILCTRNEAGEAEGTIALDVGSGNIFARIGQANTYVNRMKEFDFIRSRNEAAEPD